MSGVYWHSDEKCAGTEKQRDELLAFILKWHDAINGHPNVPAFQAPWAADFIREAETLIDQAAEKAGVPSPPKAELG